MSYAEYKEYCEKWNFKQKYVNSSQKYIVFSYLAYGSPIINARLAAVEYTNNSDVNLYIWDKTSGSSADISAYIIIIPTSNNIDNINIQQVITRSKYNNIKNNNFQYDPDQNVYKLIIYLYPTMKVKLSIKLGYEDKITCSYPKYIDGWNVLANPNGNLVDLDTKKNLYSLYYESKNTINFQVEDEGFVVNGTDNIEFLEEKLAKLGLTEREAEEFIIYWLLKLQNNKYNYIRFASMEEINKNMPLDFSLEPDTLIRVLMVYKSLDEPINIKVQQLIAPERRGFVAVEWSGTEIK